MSAVMIVRAVAIDLAKGNIFCGCCLVPSFLCRKTAMIIFCFSLHQPRLCAHYLIGRRELLPLHLPCSLFLSHTLQVRLNFFYFLCTLSTSVCFCSHHLFSFFFFFFFFFLSFFFFFLFFFCLNFLQVQ